MSGEFCFRVGVPAKSSSMGILLLVVPNLVGICSFGKTVNNHGISKAALKLSFSLGDVFNFHALSVRGAKSSKLDPSLYHFHTDMELCRTLLGAAQEGDLATLVFLRNLGFNLNYGDYDGRRAAHMAAQYGQSKALRYIHSNGAAIDEKDRWGRLPIDKAMQNGHDDVIELLRKWTNEERARVQFSEDAAGEVGRASAYPSPLLSNRVDRSGAPVAAKIGIVKRRVSITCGCETEDSSGDEAD